MDRKEELLKEAKKANAVDRERADLFGAMVKTSAWEQYVALLDAMIQSRADDVMAAAGSVDRMVGLEYVKGAMSGLIMARDLPSVTIAAMAQLRQDSLGLDNVDSEMDDDDVEFDD